MDPFDIIESFDILAIDFQKNVIVSNSRGRCIARVFQTINKNSLFSIEVKGFIIELIDFFNGEIPSWAIELLAFYFTFLSRRNFNKKLFIASANFKAGRLMLWE